MKPTISAADINSLLCLLPNSEADMQVIATAEPVRLKTRYFGTDGEQCLIFQYPASNNVHDPSNLIETDTQLIIRYVLDEPYGEVVAFKVRVLRVLDIPIPMLITTFPKALQKLGLRAQKRAISGVPVDIVFDEQGNREADGLIVDISKNGCQLFIAYESEKQQAEINETITLCVELAERTLLLSAKVKNIRIEKNFHAFGVEFEDPDNQLERLLERYVITL